MNSRVFASPRLGKIFVMAAFLLPVFLADGSDSCAWSQLSAKEYTGSVPMPSSVDELQDEMHLGKPGQREDLLKRLGVEPGLAHAASTYVSESAIRVERLERNDLALMFIPQRDTGEQMAHLLLLQRISPKVWKVVDQETAGSWLAKIDYELIFMPGQRNESVLVHHLDSGHGTGMVAEDMEVLGIRQGHFVKLLKAKEFGQEDVMGEDKTILQKSTLQPFPDGSLEETRATSIRTTASSEAKETDRVRLTKVERRRWRWNQRAQKFEPGQFTAVQP